MSSHRHQNNVGYVKIYPMSSYEDDGFCHYCGRKPNITNPLEWDHVPALNVRLPEGAENLRKTLVRSCRECNALASDSPHVDYLERHLWLKSAYLRRYHRVIVNKGTEALDTSGMSGFLLAYLKNSAIQYEDILHAIGFGIHDISDIESPFLSTKTKDKLTIKEVLQNYVFYPGVDDEDNALIDPAPIITNQNDADEYCSLEEFLDIATEENEAKKNTIIDEDSYSKWLEKYPGRSFQLGMPENPDKVYKTSWHELALILKPKVDDIPPATQKKPFKGIQWPIKNKFN